VTIPPLLDIDIERGPGCIVVKAWGEIDFATTPVLRAKLNQAVDSAEPGEPIVLDLTGVEFIGSTGLSVLAGYDATLDLLSRPLRLVAPEGPVLQAIEVAALDLVFDLYPNLDTATP